MNRFILFLLLSINLYPTGAPPPPPSMSSSYIFNSSGTSEWLD